MINPHNLALADGTEFLIIKTKWEDSPIKIEVMSVTRTWYYKFTITAKEIKSIYNIAVNQSEQKITYNLEELGWEFLITSQYVHVSNPSHGEHCVFSFNRENFIQYINTILGA